MRRNTVRETAFHDDDDESALNEAHDAMMDEEDPMMLEKENTDFDDDVDDDDDSWGLMDQADQEAIEQEEELSTDQASSTVSEGEGGDSGQWRGGAVRNNQADDAVSRVVRRDNHRSESHRFIVTPEQRPTTVEVVVTEDAEDWDDDDEDLDEDPYDRARLPLDRLSLLMRRSDQSRRCLQKHSLPTRFYGSSRFFSIALDRQQLRRMMDDA